jgi:hypothetical protein
MSVARHARAPDNCLNSGASMGSLLWATVGVLMKTIPKAGMNEPSRSLGGPPLEYSTRRDIAEFGTNCSTLSREKTCKRSCL